MEDWLSQGIVGSRRYRNKTRVESFIDLLPQNTKVKSGGCVGVDSWAAAHAQFRGLDVQEFLPETNTREGYFARNELIAKRSTQVVAFIPRNQMRSGAWNTIKWCRIHGSPYIVLDEDGNIWDRKWAVKRREREE